MIRLLRIALQVILAIILAGHTAAGSTPANGAQTQPLQSDAPGAGIAGRDSPVSSTFQQTSMNATSLATKSGWCDIVIGGVLALLGVVACVDANGKLDMRDVHVAQAQVCTGAAAYYRQRELSFFASLEAAAYTSGYYHGRYDQAVVNLGASDPTTIHWYDRWQASLVQYQDAANNWGHMHFHAAGADQVAMAHLELAASVAEDGGRSRGMGITAIGVGAILVLKGLYSIHRAGDQDDSSHSSIHMRTFALPEPRIALAYDF